VQPFFQIFPKLKTFQVGLVAAVAALILMTTVAVNATLLSSSTGDDNDLDVATAQATEFGLASADTLATPPPAPEPAPADGQASSAVESVDEPLDDLQQPLASQVEFKKVKVRQPRLRVTVSDDSALRRIRKMKGVSFATSMHIGTVPVGESRTPVKVAAVDPEEFRMLTPQITADAVAVWERIVEGDAAFTHDSGNRLKAELGSFVPAGTEGFTLRVGAFASNGIPPVADALVTPETAQGLGLQGQSEVLVSLREGVDPKEMAQRIARRAGGRVSIIEEPQARRAFLTGADARNAFEPFTYIDMGDGMIQIDPDWVSRNIVRRPMPLLKGEVVCHRLFVDQLYGALKEIEDRGLGHLIDPSQYGGCWVPRHIDFNPAKPLSMHAWGLAADFNVSTNGLGMKPQMDRRIVEVFDRWGFVWGGRWSRPDGMHFELGALVRNSPQG
jgi:hypothetical protein